MWGRLEWRMWSELSFRRWWEMQLRAVGGSSLCFKSLFLPFPSNLFSSTSQLPCLTKLLVEHVLNSKVWLLETWKGDKQCFCKCERSEPSWVPALSGSSALWLYDVQVPIRWADAISNPGERPGSAAWLKLFCFWSSKSAVMQAWLASVVELRCAYSAGPTDVGGY